MRFKLLRSIFQTRRRVRKGATGKIMEGEDKCDQCNGMGKVKDGEPCVRCYSTGAAYVLHTYKAGDTVESDHDLEKLHGREKFQNLDALTGDDNASLKRRIAELEAQLAAKSAPASAEPTRPIDTDAIRGVEPDMGISLPENLELMESHELKSLAESLGMELGNINRKSDVIKAIRKAAGAIPTGA